MKTRHIRVQGRVQGVGFRYAFRDEALALGLAGWVRNCADGSVEALVQGDAAAVERIVAWTRKGPRLARVEAVHEAAPQPELDRVYAGFQIWPSA